MEIHWRNPGDLPDEAREDAESRIARLANGHTDLIDLWIDVARETHHQRGSREVSIRCQARGAELVANGRDLEPRLALRNALRAFDREVQRLRGRRTDRRSERPSGPPLHGVIDRLVPDQDHGFLICDTGERVYFHRNAVGGGLDFEKLEEGQSVALNIESGEKGSQATIVTRPLQEGV